MSVYLGYKKLTDSSLKNEKISSQSTHLVLSGNKLKNPSLHFSNLVSLDLTNNLLKMVPRTIDHLHSLKILNLGENKISEIPDFVFDNLRLTELNLQMNRIVQLPDSICSASELRKLNLSGNPLKCLPKGLIYLHLEFIDLRFVYSLEYPPSHVVESGFEAIKKWMSSDLRTLGIEQALLKERRKEIEAKEIEVYGLIEGVRDEESRKLYEQIQEEMNNRSRILRKAEEENERLENLRQSALREEEMERFRRWQEQENNRKAEEEKVYLEQMKESERKKASQLNEIYRKRQEEDEMYLSYLQANGLRQEMALQAFETGKRAELELELERMKEKESLKIRMNEIGEKMKKGLEAETRRRYEEQLELQKKVMIESERQQNEMKEIIKFLHEQTLESIKRQLAHENPFAKSQYEWIEESRKRQEALWRRQIREMNIDEQDRLQFIRDQKQRNEQNYLLAQRVESARRERDNIERSLLDRANKERQRREILIENHRLYKEYEDSVINWKVEYKQLMTRKPKFISVEEANGIIEDEFHKPQSKEKTENSKKENHKTDSPPSYIQTVKETECKICQKEPIDSIVLECGHACCCQRCAHDLKKCPICKSRVTKIVDLVF